MARRRSCLVHGFTDCDRDVRGTAARALREFGRGQSILAASVGQYNMTDVLEAVIAYLPAPTRLDICVWTMAAPDLARLLSWVDTGRVAAPVRLLMDRSTPSRANRDRKDAEHGEAKRRWAVLANEAATPRPRALHRLSYVHAKFALLSAGDWRVAVNSSGNMDRAVRLEVMHVADDANAHAMLSDVFGRVWERCPDRLAKAQNRAQLVASLGKPPPVAADPFAALNDDLSALASLGSSETALVEL